MPETFCYLLGAGASCKVLPVSENFPEKMEQFLSEYNAFRVGRSKKIVWLKVYPARRIFKAIGKAVDPESESEKA